MFFTLLPILQGKDHFAVVLTLPLIINILYLLDIHFLFIRYLFISLACFDVWIYAFLHCYLKTTLGSGKKWMTCFTSWLIIYFPYYTYIERTPDVKMSKILGRKKMTFEKKRWVIKFYRWEAGLMLFCAAQLQKHMTGTLQCLVANLMLNQRNRFLSIFGAIKA